MSAVFGFIEFLASLIRDVRQNRRTKFAKPCKKNVWKNLDTPPLKKSSLVHSTRRFFTLFLMNTLPKPQKTRKIFFNHIFFLNFPQIFLKINLFEIRRCLKARIFGKKCFSTKLAQILLFLKFDQHLPIRHVLMVLLKLLLKPHPHF